MATKSGEANRASLETRYLAEVRQCVADVPVRQRRDLLRLVAVNLDERPRASDWPELLADLGRPDDYALEVRREMGIPDKITTGYRISKSGWVTRALVVVALVVIASGLAAFKWDRDRAVVDVSLGNNCGAVQVGDSGVQVEHLEAGDVTEARMTYVDAAEIKIGMCLTAQEDIEVLKVASPSAKYVLLRQVGTGAKLRNGAVFLDAGSERSQLPVPLGPRTPMLWVELTERMANCDHWAEGSRMTFDTVNVTYRYRGHAKTAAVDLTTAYSVVSPPQEDCPRSRN